ncbi:MAG: YadA-like family protein [Megasphaera sp.]|uniref:YadA-like family protein n=1 Tax=Megasphaera sp. TaxID=2023260 RepID=UPI003F077764
MFTGGGYLGKAALVAVVASLLTVGGLAYSPVMAADNTTVTDSNGNEVTNTGPKNKDINANITDKKNKVTDSSNAEIVGDNNTVTLACGPTMVFAANNTTNDTTGSFGIVIDGDNNTVHSSNSITLGNHISSLGGANVAIGYNSKAGSQKNPLDPNNANGATAVGTGSQAVNYRAAAFGDYTVASGTDSIGLGTTAQATGDRSISAGLSSKASGVNAIAIGDKTLSNSNDSVAIGEKARATSSQSIAIGSASSASGSYSVAIGLNAETSVEGGVALGYGSQVTTRDILKSDGNDGVVSVGKSIGQSSEKGMTRRIINVKDGVKATDAANVSQLTELKEGEHISITDSATPNEKGQTVKTIAVKVDGQIQKGNTGILSGDTVYKEVHVDKDGNYIQADNTVAENLEALDSNVKTNADNIEKNGKAIEQNSARIDTNSKNIEKNSKAIEQNSARIDTNAKNIEKNGQAIEQNSARIDTNAKNIEKNGKAIEQNSARIDTNSKNIEKNSKAIEQTSALVQTNAQNIEKNGRAIEQNSARIDTNSKNIEILQETKADTNLSNITKAGETVINNIAKKSVKVKAGSSNVSVTKNDVTDGPITYTVDIAKDLNVNSITSNSASIGKVTINKDNKGTIGGLTNTTWDAKNITSGQAATEDQLKAATKNAVNYDGDDSKTVTLREDTTIKNVANTTIEEGSKNAVNAGTVYNETRVAKDGTFIRQANTAGENLTALDHQVAANTESIYHINNRVSNLDNRVNKVGAGAAALAALHPLDFDPDDKWDFAVGYGNYRNANSVAFGAFYRPNEDTMFSLGTNFGNGENMFNAGLSFKIGQGGSGITTSKTAMAKKIESLEDIVDKQDKKIAELEALVKEQGEMIRQYVGKK